ncbi:class I SAM-dependent methyltransferase [Streptomyces sp. XD-27]|uniref:class I SAM-dependent methyltransferase n=1 Tax=Streptomyces sp. XD-27 TaxID=3062779 RepID=UPI0026F476D1|nr:class I SAM-dependent methyltransferase [Streptomyces sp. XD-27]WKX68839.1 class I SAM-dependent methyltransferase [Streptomyces sp. XD-27]
MPLSIWRGMEDCLQAMVERRPSAVLDAGIGFGLWGGLLRQYLDVWSGRVQPSQWATRIDGIEIDEKRVQPHARHLYTEILVGDIRRLVPSRAAQYSYDAILFGDVIEHLPKDDGRLLLDAAAGLCPLVVVRIPLGDGWRREGREEPDHHRSQWYASDFTRYPCTVREYDYFGNPYGLIVIEPDRNPPMPSRLLTEADQCLERLERRLERLVRR